MNWWKAISPSAGFRCFTRSKFLLSMVTSSLTVLLILCSLFALQAIVVAEDGVYVRFQVAEPPRQEWNLQLGGFIHKDPWYLPASKVVVPPSGWSEWVDVKKWCGEKLHGRLQRAGGVAELPNVTIEFTHADPVIAVGKKRLLVQLATAADEKAVVKQLDEHFTGAKTSFLVSPDLKKDVDTLETASEGAQRRLHWAREASGGKRVSPKQLWLQTSFWSPQRDELNALEGEVLGLLGFNMVGNLPSGIDPKWDLMPPAGHDWVEFGPALTREDISKQAEKAAAKAKKQVRPSLFNFSDEIACRPPIGTEAKAISHFRDWLKEKQLSPDKFGVASLDEVVPIESPPVLRERQAKEGRAANHTFYWTTRFRWEAATQRIKWTTEDFHKSAPDTVLTSSLVADHPYFGVSGMGMGMDTESTTWGGWPLSLDWFSLARERVLDVAAIEDWLGLQYMYGPSSTWDGFQLIGWQAAIFRSGSRGEMPIMTWITPSDQRNFRLKSASALCQGSKHFFFWTYGPTATSTENYWSDNRSAYDGVATLSRQLAAAEHIIAPGKLRPTRVALLYTLASDLWQPYGYLTQSERRLTYFSLIHDQFGVDLLTETDVEQGRLSDYKALYVCDPNVAASVCSKIRDWVNGGGHLYASAGAASRDEFDEPSAGLSDVLGILPKIEVTPQKARYDRRGELNSLDWLDQISLNSGASFGALGLKAVIEPQNGTVVGKFADGGPAVVEHRFGKGRSIYVATCPAVSYAKDAKFVADDLKEKWPSTQRNFINSIAKGVSQPAVKLSSPVIEAGVYDSPSGTALVLGNFTYQPLIIAVSLSTKTKPRVVKSTTTDAIIPFTATPDAGDWKLEFSLPLEYSEIVLVEP